MVKGSIYKAHQGPINDGSFNHYVQHFNYTNSTIWIKYFNIWLEHVQHLRFKMLKLYERDVEIESMKCWNIVFEMLNRNLASSPLGKEAAAGWSSDGAVRVAARPGGATTRGPATRPQEWWAATRGARELVAVDTVFWHVSRKVIFCEEKVADLEETKRCTVLESADGVCPMGQKNILWRCWFIRSGARPMESCR